MAREFSSQDAKNLIVKHESLLSSLGSAEKTETALKENIIKAADTFVSREIIVALQSISVEELGRIKKGIRVKTLASGGFTTMADVYGASVYNLSSVKGISEDTARAIKGIASDFARKTKSEIKIRLTADDKNMHSTALVKAVSIYKNSLIYIRQSQNLLTENGGGIKRALVELKPATSGVRWLFASKSTKRRALEAYETLTELLKSDYNGAALNAAIGLRKTSQMDMKEAWADFAENSAEFYSILEKTVPDLLETDGFRYGLPENLMLSVQNERPCLDGLKCTLRRYQEWGVKYILHGKRVLLGDEMGLGKTVQAIAVMVSLRNIGATHFVVVCPAGVITNWCREIVRHSSLSVVKVHGADKNAALSSWVTAGGVAVTTYETTSSVVLPDGFKFSLLVADEAHYIKNPEAKRTASTKELCARADRLLFMTGTALENRVDEMIELISVLRPDIARQAGKLAFMSSSSQFRNKVAPVYYRRKREDVLTELPELIESKEWCAMNNEEERAYEDAILGKRYAEARRVSWNIGDMSRSSKAGRLLEIVEEAEAEGRKVIVFSFFLDTVSTVSALLGKRCMSPITGAVNPKKRQEIIDGFNNAPTGSVLVAQIQSGGTGLNIQSASVVVICEPQLKPSIENQAVSRAYRMGQARNVLVYRLLCENSVDEKITELLEEKQTVFDTFADKSAALQNTEIDDKSFGNIISEEIERINAKRGITQAIGEAVNPSGKSDV